MNWAIQLCELNFDHKEREAVDRVLRSEWLTMGEETSNFEFEFSDFIGHEHNGIFVSSATAGLHLILMALGITHGDEVILPGLTFVSDANVVVQLGATPVFADSTSLYNLNVSIEDVKNKITSKTKAIVIVHFAGFPMDLNELVNICVEKQIKLIEDCAHAPGAKINGKTCGSIADFSFFSFFSNKNLATGEGGMVFAKDEQFQNKIRLMRSHGMDSLTLDRHKGRTHSYDVKVHGLNYRGDEIRAAIGRVQLEKLSSGNDRRKEIFRAYLGNLKGSDIIVPFSDTCLSETSAYHIMPVILPENTDRYNVMSKLKAAGIQSSIHYPNFRDFTAYADFFNRDCLSVVDAICARELTLPLHPRMNNEQVVRVTDSLLEAL